MQRLAMRILLGVLSSTKERTLSLCALLGYLFETLLSQKKLMR